MFIECYIPRALPWAMYFCPFRAYCLGVLTHPLFFFVFCCLMLFLCLAYFFRHVLKLWQVVLDYLFRAAHPWAFAEYALHVFSEYHLACHKQFGKLVVSLAVLLEYLLGACILVVDHLEHLVVHNLCRSL